jgi:tRNA-dihydrouridine synthase B
VIKKSPVPVTVKIRTGWDSSCLNAPEVARYAQDAGVKAIFIHGRTKAQLYSGAVDYETIRKVKKAVSVPVIGSGDVFSGELAKLMFDQTGCDGILVARGSLGNPWIFEEIRLYLKTGHEPAKPAMGEIIQTMLEHLDLSVDFFGPKYGVVIFRKFFGWYTKGFRKIRPLRETISRLKTRKDVEDVINQICLIRYPRQPGSSVK